MKKLLFLSVIVRSIVCQESVLEPTTISTHNVKLQQEEIAEIISNEKRHVYFGPEVCSLVQDLPHIQKYLDTHKLPCQHLTKLCEYIAQDKTTAPRDLVEAALYEVAQSLSSNQITMSQENVERLSFNIKEYYKKIESGEVVIVLVSDAHSSDSITRNCASNKSCYLDVHTLSTDCLTVNGNATIRCNLIVGGNETINGTLTLLGNPSSLPTNLQLTIDPATGLVRQGTGSSSGVIVNGCQAGPLTIGTNNATSLTLATGACTNRLNIDPNGAVVISMPSAGEALTVNGNIVLPVANTAGTQGLFEFGGTGATNAKLYERGTRNFWAAPGTVNATITTGDDNVSIGTTANSTITTSNNTVALGNNARTTGGDNDSIVIGDSANTTVARVIVVGSKDSSSTGVVPTVTGINAIVIGSASGTLNGASANGVSAIAVGGSGGTFAGATAAGAESIALGVNAISSDLRSIALGSASGIAGGIGPTTSNDNAIAIGSANGANRGALASGVSSIAVGGADGATFAGALASGGRSIGIGLNATASSALGIAIGSASGTVGGTAPTAGAANAIAIGSASGAFAGASGAISGGTSSVAIGGSNGVFVGANTAATGDRGVAIGVNAIAGGAASVVLGSASTTVGGSGPTTTSGGSASIAIGSANGALAGATASSTSNIALGSADGTFAGAANSGSRSIAIGVNATTAQTSTIVIGSASGVAGGLSPRTVAGGTNSVVIGSASGALAGPSSAGTTAVLISPSDGVFAGGVTPAAGDRGVAMGVNATSSGVSSVALGSASGVAGGVGPIASGTNAIAIGSGSGANPGAAATGANTIAIGGADGTFIGARATATRSVAIGNGASVGQVDTILLGNTAATALRVGIGTATPTARLHVVGPVGTPVCRLVTGNSLVSTAPLINITLFQDNQTDLQYDTATGVISQVVSSKRFKKNFRPIGIVSAGIYKLNPLLYDMKEENGGDKDQTGFIAEEVAPIFPSLIAYNKDGEIQAIKYDCFHALTINEIQKHKQQLDSHNSIISNHSEILTALLAELEQLQEKMRQLEEIENN